MAPLKSENISVFQCIACFKRVLILFFHVSCTDDINVGHPHRRLSCASALNDLTGKLLEDDLSAELNFAPLVITLTCVPICLRVGKSKACEFRSGTLSQGCASVTHVRMYAGVEAHHGETIAPPGRRESTNCLSDRYALPLLQLYVCVSHFTCLPDGALGQSEECFGWENGTMPATCGPLST